MDSHDRLLNALLGVQNLPNSVPSRTLRNLNDFAEEAGRIPNLAVEQMTYAPLMMHPMSAPTLSPLAWGRFIPRLMRGVARDAMGVGGPYQDDYEQFTTTKGR